MEAPRLTLSSSDVLLSRPIMTPDEAVHLWSSSDPIPGSRVVKIWEIYPGIQVVLAHSGSGKFNLYLTSDLKTFRLCHQHDTEIFSLINVQYGHALLSTADGWWRTVDSGLNWSKMDFDPEGTTHARAAAVIPARDESGQDSWYICVYSDVCKFYLIHYPEGSLAQTYDPKYDGLWYPAIDGSSVGLLAGVGPYLLRSEDLGKHWTEIRRFKGTIKTVVASNKSSVPVFMIEVLEKGSSKLYKSMDLGDTLELVLDQVGMMSSVQSVYPTGTNDLKTMFAVVGRRTTDGPQIYTLLEP